MRDISRQKAYLVLGCKPWNRTLFDEKLRRLPGKWKYFGSPREFSVKLLKRMCPRYVFVLHWSWKVPDEIVSQFECVCFHMTDVPFGRGGSPLQNLIVLGRRETKLTALRMTGDFDAGPVYSKEKLSLDGGAEEIYLRAGRLSAEMIERIIRIEPMPTPQRGKAVNFKRRKPEESEIRSLANLETLYDFIRMLDADGYPRAFLEHGGFRFEFGRAALYHGRIVADVKISETGAQGSRK